MERHGRIHTGPSWMDSRRNGLFACVAFVFGKVLANRFERVPVRRDFEK